ncbi:class I SAM-dependent methyltransferase [Pedobacter sp. WC2501]|uniref:class I SAM-dependent methyltransferase n=1 Tax=Pedobacter sp. WC2501 TaxID=3461400 RepID=UPI00404642E0
MAFRTRTLCLAIAQSGVDIIRDRKLASLKEAQTFDGYKIPYGDDTFDLIILAHVLEHVEHERILILELKRVAKYIVVEVPKDYRFGLDQRMKQTVKFNAFINRKAPKTFSKNLKIELEYGIKKTLGNLFVKKKQEQFANAYAVLTKKSDHNLQIF